MPDSLDLTEYSSNNLRHIVMGAVTTALQELIRARALVILTDKYTDRLDLIVEKVLAQVLREGA